MATDWDSPEKVRKRLRALGRAPRLTWHGRGSLDEQSLADSAVLIPVTERAGRLELLFTERSHELRTHSGEISFPGGRREPEDDSLVETALRETHEEVGLAPDEIEVYGALTRVPTVTGFEVTAYVGEYASDCELIIDPGEIHLVFRAPLDELANPRAHRLEDREFGGETFPVHYFDYEDHVIWGVTGFLLYQFLEFLR